MRTVLLWAAVAALCGGLAACGNDPSSLADTVDVVTDPTDGGPETPIADSAEVEAEAVADGAAPGDLVVEAPADVDAEQPSALLDPSGCYDLSSTMDFSGCGAGAVASLVHDLLYDPGTFVADMTVKGIKMYLGEAWGALPEETQAAFGDAVAASVHDWLLAHPLVWAPCLSETLAGIEPLLSQVGVDGRLQLGPPPGNGAPFPGTVTWAGTHVSWDHGCEPTSACGVAPSNPLQGLCTHDEAGDSCCCPVEACVDACSESEVQATVQELDQLSFKAVPLPVDPGRVNRFVLNELFVPWATAGQFHELGDALWSIVDCQGVADGVPADVLADVSLDASVVEDCCNGALGVLVNPVEETIGVLYFTLDLVFAGRATMKDENQDQVVEKLDEGVLQSFPPGQQQPAFLGTFEGSRVECP